MAVGWLAKDNLTEDDFLNADMLNSLARDDRDWGGDVNGGGHKLSNVILSGSGGFEFLPSPVRITPGVGGGSAIETDQTIAGNQLARWVFGKDATAESGANTGSNFSIQRFNDAGTVIDTPFSIARSNGLITMGPQKWTGPIDGNGQTLSNISIPGMVSTAGSYADPPWITSLAYGKLTGVPSSFTPSAHVHAAADITSGVIATARLGAGTANSSSYLRGDGQWAAVAGGTNIQDEGTGLTLRAALNFTGAGVTATDDAANNRTNVTIPGGGGAAQTPWLQDVNANGFKLFNTGGIGMNVSAAVNVPPYALWVNNPNRSATVAVFTCNDGNTSNLQNPSIGLGVNAGTFWGTLSGIQAFAGSYGDGHLMLSTRTGDALVERLRIKNDGSVGVATNNPAAQFHVAGSGNVIVEKTVTSAAPLLHLSSPNDLDTPCGALLLTRYHPSPANVRGSSIFHYYSSTAGREMMCFALAVSGSTPVDFTKTKMALSQASAGYSSLTVGDGTLPWPYDPLTITGLPFVADLNLGINLRTGGNEFHSRLTLRSDSGGGFLGVHLDCQDQVGLIITPNGQPRMPNLPSSNPGAGTKALWYDPADGNKVKFAP